MNILKTGYLFAASEFSNHTMYNFSGTGEENVDVVTSSLEYLKQKMGDGVRVVTHNPREPKNLIPVD
jgi:splicing factor 3B subunit 3